MGTKSQRAVYDYVNILDDQVYVFEWVRFFEGQVYEWGRFWITGSHTRTKITPKLPPHPPPPQPPPPREICPPKNENFQIKKSDSFHISQYMFWAEIRKIMYTAVNPSFTLQKWGLRGSKRYRSVFVMWSQKASQYERCIWPRLTFPPVWHRWGKTPSTQRLLVSQPFEAAAVFHCF